MELTAQDKVFFETFGYLRFNGLLYDRIDEITHAFEQVWENNGGGHYGQQHDGRRRSCIVPFIDQHEVLCSLLDDERIISIAAGLLGEDFNYYTSDGNYYAGDTYWHSRPFFGNRKALKVAFYLDPLTPETGALRIIPGSHHFGDVYSDSLHEMLNDTRPTLGIQAADVPSNALECTPGDIFVFNHCVKHGSFGGGQRRRLFVINLCEHFPDEAIGHVREMVSALARFWIKSAYGKTMIRTANRRRMKHLAQILAHQDHLPELAAEERARALEPARG